jgi:hypothetical protein
MITLVELVVYIIKLSWAAIVSTENPSLHFLPHLVLMTLLYLISPLRLLPLMATSSLASLLLLTYRHYCTHRQMLHCLCVCGGGGD